jgi:tripartite-type tricarboxylate transporter receptor subunit TctC
MALVNRRTAIAQLGALGASPWWAHAQTRYPERPIRIVIPVPAGGQTDVLARLLGQKLTDALGQPVIVESKPGVATVLASELVARAPADGHTLLLSLTQVVQAPLLLPKVGYDLFKDLAPVIRVADSTALLCVATNSPLQSVADLVSKSKGRTPPFTYGTNGHASTVHLYTEMFARQQGISLTHVPYKGEAPLVPDLVTGRVDAGWFSGMTGAQLAKDQKVRILATTGRQRMSGLPQVPTFGELGFPGMDADGWIGVFAPGATPRPIVDRLATELHKAITLPEVRERLVAFGLEPAGGTADEFSRVVRRTHQQWGQIIQTTGIRLE